MSKVLVDRELLERAASHLEWDGDESMTVIQFAQKCDALADELRRSIAQPAEAEGEGNARLMNTLAELARRAPLRTLHTICETQHQVSTVKLERYLEPIGDTLAGYAFTLRIDFDKLSAALSAVTAERDRLESMLIRTATRHFALQIKDRADDKKLDECLSEGIAMLEAERDRLQQFEAAYNEWHDKTEWVQETANAHELGKHRADVLKDRIDQLRAEVEAAGVTVRG